MEYTNVRYLIFIFNLSSRDTHKYLIQGWVISFTKPVIIRPSKCDGLRKFEKYKKQKKKNNINIYLQYTKTIINI